MIKIHDIHELRTRECTLAVGDRRYSETGEAVKIESFAVSRHGQLQVRVMGATGGSFEGLGGTLSADVLLRRFPNARPPERSQECATPPLNRTFN